MTVRSVIWRGIELAEFRAVDVRIIGTALTGILNWAYVWYSPSGDENGRHDSHQRCGRAAFTGSAECCIRCNSSHFEGGAEGMPQRVRIPSRIPSRNPAVSRWQRKIRRSPPPSAAAPGAAVWPR
jgi:hypothetical protein